MYDSSYPSSICDFCHNNVVVKKGISGCLESRSSALPKSDRDSSNLKLYNSYTASSITDCAVDNS